MLGCIVQTVRLKWRGLVDAHHVGALRWGSMNVTMNWMVKSVR